MNQEFNNLNQNNFENQGNNNISNNPIQSSVNNNYNQYDYQQNNQFMNQPTSVQNANKKTKKTIIWILLAIIAVGLVVAGVLIFKPSTTNNNDPKSVVKQYVSNIIEKEYSKNYSLVLIPENNFVENSDYVEYVQKLEKYHGLTGLKIDKIEEQLISEKNAKYNVVLKDEDDTTKKIIIELKNENGWKVVENNLYIENWEISVPKGTTVYINSVEVPKFLLSDDVGIDKNEIKYIIPAISMVKKEIVLDNPLQKKTIEMTPLNSNSGEKIYLELTDKNLIEKAHNYIKTTWNEMYKDYLNNTDVSDVAQKYFVSTMSIDDVNTYYKKAFDSLTEGTSGYKYINYNLNEIVNSKSQNYVISDEIITINFGYKISWNWSFTMDMRTMTRYSKIRLKLEGDSFKIYEVPDARLFSYGNQYTSEY